MKTVRYAFAAERSLSKLVVDVRDRIERKVEQYAATGDGDVKAMSGSPTLRLRVGDYRVIFTEDLVVLDVIDVGHRGQIYRRERNR